MSTPIAVRAADSRRRSRRRRLIAKGEWNPWMDASLVRAHMISLQAQGVTRQRIAELSKTPHSEIVNIAYEGPRKPATVRVRTETAERILAVRPAWDGLPDGAFIPSTAAVRRLRALVAIGWPPPVLAERLGFYLTYLNKILRGEKSTVTARTDRAVDVLHDELWKISPASRGVRAASIARAKSRAKANDWDLPAAWDDDHIHDPAAQPDRGQQVPRYMALGEDCIELERQEHTREQIAERLGVTRDGLQRALSLYRKAQSGEVAA